MGDKIEQSNVERNDFVQYNLPASLSYNGETWKQARPLGIYFSSVSYTHLDVYKRQAYMN